MKKKLLAVLMTLCMVVLIAPAVLADGSYVAKIGSNEYSTFDEAMTAANGMTGNVTVEIYGKVEYSYSTANLTGSYNSITFIGKSTDAEISITRTGNGAYLTCSKTAYFTDLILSKANPKWENNAGHMGNYFSIQGGTVTYTNCIFPNGACTSTGTATYNGCTFRNTIEYGLWVYDDALVTVNGGTIDSIKGIKVYSEGETSVTSTLTVQNATFTENVTAKPAVAIGYAESITLIGNTYNNTTGVLELDSGSDADCEGVDFTAQDAEGNDIANTLTAVDRSNGNAACGVLVDGKIYTTVTEAVKDAEAGDTVTLLHDTEETVELPMGVTLDTNGKTAENIVVPEPVATINGVGYKTLQEAIDAAINGDVITLVADCDENVTVNKSGVAIIIDGKISEDENATVGGSIQINIGQNVTIKNIDFVWDDNAAHDFIANVGSPTGKNYNTTLLVKDCTFIGNNQDNVVAVRTIHPTSVTIEDCFGTGLHSFLQNTGGQKIEIRNVTITDSKSGLSVGTTPDVTISDCDITVREYGIRANAELDKEDSTELTIKDCNVNAFIPVVIRKAKADYSVEISGTNTMTATNTDGIWCAIGTSEYEENGSLPTAPTGDVDVKLKDIGVEISGIYGLEEEQVDAVVARIGSTDYYTLADAFKAATSGATIEILRDVTVSADWDCRSVGAKFLVPVTINGNDHTLKFTGKIYDANWNTVFRFEENATVNDLTIDVSEASGVKYGISAKYGITMDNCTLIGQVPYPRFAVIYGEGAGSEGIVDVVVSVTNSTFINWQYGVRDNWNGQDAKKVTVTGNTFQNADVDISAYDEVAFNDNTMEDSWATITSYTDSETLQVNAVGNTLEDNTATKSNEISVALNAEVIADPEFDIVMEDENGTEYYEVTFDIPANATVEVRDALGNVCEPVNGVYVLENGTYTYTVNQRYCDPEKGSFTVNGATQTITVESLSETVYYEILIPKMYNITIKDSIGGKVTGSRTAAAGTTVKLTVTPDEGYALADLLVNAGRRKIYVSEKNGTYNFNIPYANVTVTAVFEKIAEEEAAEEVPAEWANPYSDVSADAWYYEDIEFVTESGLMIGTSEDGTAFSPAAAVNRAMLVTTLWRLEGSPAAAAADFSDVAADEWYTAAVDWAAANGIVLGYGDGVFGAMDDLTHEQIMAILNRYAVYKEWSEAVTGSADDVYTNSDWAEENVLWADESGMFDGIESDITNLTEGADRAELAAYLRRFCEKFIA